MADDLPTEYDVIVLGTGLSESILAAAFARIGWKVLHLDRNAYYSGDWASFSFDALQSWIEPSQVSSVDESPSGHDCELKEGESSVGLKPSSDTISGVEQTWFIRDKGPEPEEDPVQDTPVEGTETIPEDAEVGGGEPAKPEKSVDSTKETTKEWTVEDVKKASRKFNIDLTPKLLYSRGSLVELLISSDIAKYCEFKVVSRVLTWMNDKLEQVPCSRADVFATKAVSMIEKRVLMKFLTYCLDYETNPGEYEGYSDRPFKEYLISRKMSANVQHYVIHAIAMVSENTPTLEALKATKKFLMSLGRYGNTAFLWPLYGSGELPQCFCRMCAVFGGVYYLRRPIEKLVVDENKKAVGVISEGKRLNANWVVMDASFASRELVPSIKNSRTISRAIYLTNKSISDCGKDELTLLRLPSSPENQEPITVIELTQSACACPSDMLLVHMTCIGSGNPKEDFRSAEQKLFQSSTPDGAGCEDPRPKVLWSLYFNHHDHSQTDLSTGDTSNVVITTGPDDTIHFEQAVTQAKATFDKICPDEEFLPKAPNPEDIIFEGDEGQATDAGFGPTGSQAEGSEQETGPTGSQTEGTGSQAEQATGNKESTHEGEAMETEQEVTASEKMEQTTNEDAGAEDAGAIVKESSEAMETEETPQNNE